jgi:hypothetical protein
MYLMLRLPSGRTSAIKALNKNFILQTEFLSKPRPRIITSVALDGQVIHKVERTYDHDLDSETGIIAAESAVLAQHQNLEKKIQFNGADFITQTRSISISVEDRLALISGISYVIDIDEKLADANPHTVYIQSKLLGEIGDAVSAGTKMGPLKVAAINSEHGKFIIDRIEGHSYLLSVKPDAEVAFVLKEVIKG